MFVVFVVVGCSLFGLCCLSFVVRCGSLLFVALIVCRLLYVLFDVCVLFGVRCLILVVCCVCRCMMCVICSLLFGVCFVVDACCLLFVCRFSLVAVHCLLLFVVWRLLFDL